MGKTETVFKYYGYKLRNALIGLKNARWLQVKELKGHGPPPRELKSLRPGRQNCTNCIIEKTSRLC